MLKKIDNNTVRGTWFTVHVRDIHWVKYSEGGRVATIEIEGWRSPDGVVNWDVYGQSLMYWDEPYEPDDMDLSKRLEILERVSASLEVLGMPHRITQG
jgi:hypothetical protein